MLEKKQKEKIKMTFHFTIISGKGGVGKTSITASIACALADMGLPIIAGDTDVDAPNLAILFRAQGKIQDQFHVKTTEKAELDPEKCTHCKQCIDEQFCHFGALSWNEMDRIPIIDPIACEGCGGCKLLCPLEAFSIYQVDSGTITYLESPYGFSVITGETILGASTSGKLVTEMKKYTNEIAASTGKTVVIIDGPPGIGCPVIASVGGIEYSIVVIEPTKAALHDAERVMTLLKQFNIPYGVILNKADMWLEAADEIRTFLKEEEIELLGEIPLDKDWPYAIANGLPIIKYKPEGVAATEIRRIAKNLYSKIEKFLENEK